MTRNVLRPANCGSATSQPLCSHTDGGIGRVGLAQCAPPSRDTRTASASEPGQKPVIQPVPGWPPRPAGLAAMPVLSQPRGRPLPLGGSPGSRALRAASDHDRPPSGDRYTRTGFCDIAMPKLSTNQPWSPVKATATGSAPAIDSDLNQVRPPSAVPNTTDVCPDAPTTQARCAESANSSVAPSESSARPEIGLIKCQLLPPSEVCATSSALVSAGLA